jgi:tetratricopeptide (TPR) repeat protein
MTLGPGDKLGRYEIIAPLGAGGMGEVYRARDDRLDREVAIKVMPEGVAQDPERLSRFEREAKAVASLTHPNILEIHDFGTDGEITYAVTELLEGQSLREWVTRGRGDWRSALTICAAIADGLAAAHKSQIIHRDLKPENVFLTADDQVKILDFGLAKILHAEAADGLGNEAPTASMGTDPGAVMGTAGYMSPEQVRGEPVDHRTDIFALGCLLHELLCGRRAFPGNSAAEISTSILSRPSTPLEQTGCDLPVDVQPIVDRCLEKSPTKRFQDSSDLSFALRSLTTGSGSEVRAPAPRPRRGWRLAVAAGIVIVIIAAAGAVYLRNRPTAEIPVETSTGLNPNLVAVAAFENRTGTPELDDLGLVAADWLTNALARINAIDVVPMGLGVESRAGATSPQEVADATGAGIVVTGAYYLEGETLRFQANLTDAIRGALLLSLDPALGPVGQPMAAIESLGSEVAGAVASQFAGWDQAFDQNMRPPSYEAYREYITGMDFFAVDNQKAFVHYRRATEIDPDFVAPRLMMVSLLKVSEKFAEARAVVDGLSEQRQRMNPFERIWLEYHTAMLDGDSQRALAQMRRNHELAPRSTMIRFALTRNLLLSARPHEALEVISEIDDLDAWAGFGSCSFLYSKKMDAEHVLGLYDAELETARQAVETCGNKVYSQINRARAQIGRGEVDLIENTLNEGLKASDTRRYSLNLFLGIARELEAHGHPALALDVAERGVDHVRDHLKLDEATEWQRLRYAQLLVMLGRLDEADKLLLALNDEIPDDDDILGWLGIVAAERGDTQAAMHASALLRDLNRPYVRGWISFYRAGIAAHLGHSDEALSLLRDAFSRGFPWSVDLHASLELKPLRGHPDFEAILHPEE